MKNKNNKKGLIIGGVIGALLLIFVIDCAITGSKIPDKENTEVEAATEVATEVQEPELITETTEEPVVEKVVTKEESKPSYLLDASKANTDIGINTMYAQDDDMYYYLNMDYTNDGKCIATFMKGNEDAIDPSYTRVVELQRNNDGTVYATEDKKYSCEVTEISVEVTDDNEHYYDGLYCIADDGTVKLNSNEDIKDFFRNAYDNLYITFTAEFTYYKYENYSNNPVHIVYFGDGETTLNIYIPANEGDHKFLNGDKVIVSGFISNDAPGNGYDYIVTAYSIELAK